MKTKNKKKITRTKEKDILRNEQGITLVALIITIIVLVILAVVSIAAVYNSKIVEYAINGAQDYTMQAVNENQIMRGTEGIIQNGIDRINDIVNQGEDGIYPENNAPSKPEVAFVSSTTNTITFKAKSEDSDGDQITYTISLGTDSSNLNLSQSFAGNNTGEEVTLTTSTDKCNLTDYTDYYWKVVATDGKGTSEETEIQGPNKTEKTNVAPSTPEVAFVRTGTNTITFKAKSTDPDGDNITYTIYLGTDQNNLNLSQSFAGKTSGQQVTLTTTTDKCNLVDYTEYYWKVVASDTIVETNVNDSPLMGPNKTQCGTCGGAGPDSYYTCGRNDFLGQSWWGSPDSAVFYRRPAYPIGQKCAVCSSDISASAYYFYGWTCGSGHLGCKPFSMSGHADSSQEYYVAFYCSSSCFNRGSSSRWWR